MIKNHAFVKYTKKGALIPGSLVITSAYPKETANGVWEEVPMDLCCITNPLITGGSSPQRAFIKYTEYGKIVPGSLIVIKGGFPSSDGRAKWYEVPMNKCCNAVLGIPINIDQFLSRLNSCYFQITDLVPNIVYFADSSDGVGITTIADGCNDMYDDGNAYNTNLTQPYSIAKQGGVNFETSIPYTHTQYTANWTACDYTNPPMNGYIVDGTNYFGAGSSYFTNMYPGMFVLAATNVNITDFSITGGVGSDGDGVDAVYIETSHPGWTAFIKTNSNAGDPSINQIILINGSVDGASQLYDNTSEYDDHCVSELGSQNTSVISIVVATNEETPALTRQEALAIANKILDVYNDETCNPPQAFRMLFDDIASADGLVGDASNVNDWNVFFNLPTFGNEFTSVTVDGNWVNLYGGSNIEITDNLFYYADSILLKVIDNAGSIIGMGTSCFLYQVNLNQVSFPACTYITDNGSDYGSFAYCPQLTDISLPVLQTAGLYTFECDYQGGYTSLSLPKLLSAGEACFYQDQFIADRVVTYNLPKLQIAGDRCFSQVNTTTINLPSLTDLGYGCFQQAFNTSVYNLPSCANLGGNVYNNSVFLSITGNTITLTIPASRMTCDAGNPDGDIVSLQSQNTVTIITT